jgi:hypothetical protein
MALAKFSKISISKVKYQSEVDHFLRQSGNRSKEFVPSGHTVKMEYYVEVVSRLVQRIRKTSVSGKRKLVALALQRETSHCSIDKAVLGKHHYHTLLIYPYQTFSYSPESNPS